jgi:hypothetical protein
MPKPKLVIVDRAVAATASPGAIADAIADLDPSMSDPATLAPPRAADLALVDLDPSRQFAPEPVDEPTTAALKCSGSRGRKGER